MPNYFGYQTWCVLGANHLLNSYCEFDSRILSFGMLAVTLANTRWVFLFLISFYYFTFFLNSIYHVVTTFVYILMYARYAIGKWICCARNWLHFNRIRSAFQSEGVNNVALIHKSKKRSFYMHKYMENSTALYSYERKLTANLKIFTLKWL